MVQVKPVGVMCLIDEGKCLTSGESNGNTCRSTWGYFSYMCILKCLMCDIKNLRCMSSIDQYFNIDII